MGLGQTGGAVLRARAGFLAADLLTADLFAAHFFAADLLAADFFAADLFTGTGTGFLSVCGFVGC
ncbi:hypothetical protein ACFWWC_37035 [Streptomyces sp. NPDC058642]|uniref:hypothetical protein n=1 Tax=Streptomyces sp. NPDC058642 TaxID=3346572 RepID=UPI003662A60B